MGSSSDQSRIQVLSVENVTEVTVSARIRMLAAEQESRGETSRRNLLRHTNGASQQGGKLIADTPDHSVGLFKKLQQIVVEGNEEKTRLLSTMIDTVSSSKIITAVVGVSDLKILPSESDVKNILTTGPDMVEEEQELYRYASSKGDDNDANQFILNKVERQAMIDEVKKEEKIMVDKIETMSKNREEAVMKEIEKERILVHEIKEQSKSHEEAMMNKIEKMSESNESKLKVLHIEL